MSTDVTISEDAQGVLESYYNGLYRDYQEHRRLKQYVKAQYAASAMDAMRYTLRVLGYYFEGSEAEEPWSLIPP